MTDPKVKPRGDGPAEAAGPTDLGDLSAKLAEAEAKARGNWDLYLRARADYENYRRRVERDLAAMLRRGKQDLLLRLLELADALERAAAWEAERAGRTDGEATAPTGFSHLHRQLLKLLADEGVTPIDSAGRPFDPKLHEAIDVVADPSAAAGTVMAELQRGYIHEGEVLRPARVRVAQPPAAPDAALPRTT